MPNHGYCKNCWWYKRTENPVYKIEDNKLHEYIGKGICYMLSSNIGIKDVEVYHYCDDNSYCPDYWNRIKGEKTNGKLDDWIKGAYNQTKQL